MIENDQIYYVRTDHIGRPVFATNGAGAKVWEASYKPFGGVDVTLGGAIDLRFPGQWFQAESGLHQNWMRDYDPTTGRYVQADPLGLVDGSSVYGYALQSPYRYVDPTGEFIPFAPLAWAFFWIAIDIALDEGCYTGEDFAWSLVGLVNPFHKVKTAANVVRAGSQTIKHADDFFDGTKYSKKVLNQMKQGDFHAFPEGVKAFQSSGKVTKIIGGDGVVRSKLEIPGGYKGKQGNFSFIKEPNGVVNHRLFEPF